MCHIPKPMNTRKILDAKVVNTSTEAELAEARKFLLNGLVRATGLPLELLSNIDGLFYFEIRATLRGIDDYRVCWDGHVSYSDYRDDGLYAYGAKLFLYAGVTRLVPQGFAYRYLLFDQDSSGVACWRDLGWQIDDYDEWADRKLELGT